MATGKVEEKTSLPADIQALLDATPETPNAAETIRRDLAALGKVPEFVSGYLKAQFVEDIFRAMRQQGINPSNLAKMMGYKPQYVYRVLSEKANFTFDTMAKFACALNLQVAARLFAEDERMVILPAVSKPNLVVFGYVRETKTTGVTVGGSNAGYTAA